MNETCGCYAWNHPVHGETTNASDCQYAAAMARIKELELRLLQVLDYHEGSIRGEHGDAITKDARAALGGKP